MIKPPPVAVQPPEQGRYATWLEWGTRLGLAVLVLGFAAYVSGLLPGALPPARLAALWGLPVSAYLQQAGAPLGGWAWVGQLPQGDALGMLGIAILAGCSLPALLALVPLYAQRGDKAYVGLCVAVVAVVLLAASGLLAGGH